MARGLLFCPDRFGGQSRLQKLLPAAGIQMRRLPQKGGIGIPAGIGGRGRARSKSDIEIFHAPPKLFAERRGGWLEEGMGQFQLLIVYSMALEFP